MRELFDKTVARKEVKASARTKIRRSVRTIGTGNADSLCGARGDETYRGPRIFNKTVGITRLSQVRGKSEGRNKLYWKYSGEHWSF